MAVAASVLASLHRDGFATVEAVLSPQEVEALRRAIELLLAAAPARGGVRRVLSKCPTARELATTGALAALAKEVLGEAARPIKATLFDKTAAANWKVPWHQDVTIAVAEQKAVAGFSTWTVKDGVPHTQPPARILEGVLALRSHLDDAGAGNGALQVLPGSHRVGRLSAGQIDELRSSRTAVTCPVRAGSAFLMFPLLLHASSASAHPSHRRVLHVEYTAQDLPGGLRWAEV